VQLELRRLKNIKRAEIQKRLEAIRAMSGGGTVAEEALEGDFDPDKWDQQVTVIFNCLHFSSTCLAMNSCTLHAVAGLASGRCIVKLCAELQLCGRLDCM
jgi:KRI1-like family